MEGKLKKIKPVKPAAAWQGGKRYLSATLVEMINQVDHARYCEPFVGMGGIFFRRTMRPDAEIINDYSRDVVTLFRVLNKHYAAFIGMLKYQLSSRDEFERLLAQDPDTLTDLERAARFIYVQRIAFGGKVSGRNFGVDMGRPSRFNLVTLEADLEDIYERLSSVVIENLDWADFVKKYDRADTLFYMDPPYFDCEDDYGKDMFSSASFDYMSRLMKCIKGKFILSINDKPRIRQLFADFHMQEVDVVYSIGGKDTAGKKFGELIITNIDGLMEGAV